MKYLNWQAWLIVAALGGCSSETSSSNVAVGVELALTSSAESQAKTDDGSLVAREAQGGEFAVEHARAVVERIELYLPEGETEEDDSEKITIRGPFVVDLVDGTSTPEIANVMVPAGHYRRVDVRFSNDGHGKLDASDPLHDLTFVAEGTFTPADAEAMPFNLALDFNEEARFESEAGIDLGEDSAREVLLKLDVSKWFTGLPIGNCMEEGKLAADGGTLVLDERAECSHVERDLRAAIKTSGRLEHR